MSSPLKRAIRLAARFRRKDNGSATVEAVLWLPLFMVVFGLMVDASMIFHGQSKVLRVIQDANRNISMGRFTTGTEVEQYINAQLALFDVVPAKTEATADDNVVVTLVSVPARQFQLLGYFSALLDLNIEVTSAHLLDSADIDAIGMTTTTSTY